MMKKAIAMPTITTLFLTGGCASSGNLQTDLAPALPSEPQADILDRHSNPDRDREGNGDFHDEKADTAIPSPQDAAIDRPALQDVTGADHTVGAVAAFE